MAEKCDCLVIGAGAVGLSVARALARAGREVLVLERHESFGTETSSRNSEVIHAGIYYPTGSVKARTCVRGKELLYEYCERYHVPYERIGKIIVATTAQQFDALREYQRQAKENGAGELTWLSQRDVEKLEPAVACRAGVLSHSTGIIDSHSYMLSLLGDLEAHNGVVSYRTEVSKITIDSATLMNKGFEVIEASWLFGVGIDQIEVVIHRESIVHSIVEFCDGAMLAHLGRTDMVLPIRYALTHPERAAPLLERLDLAAVGRLTFAGPDRQEFGCLDQCYAAGRAGGTVPTSLNAANEIAVSAFLSGRIGFLDIEAINGFVLERALAGVGDGTGTLAGIMAADAQAREWALAATDTRQR